MGAVPLPIFIKINVGGVIKMWPADVVRYDAATKLHTLKGGGRRAGVRCPAVAGAW